VHEKYIYILTKQISNTSTSSPILAKRRVAEAKLRTSRSWSWIARDGCNTVALCRVTRNHKRTI